jgi:hypothetical protein
MIRSSASTLRLAMRVRARNPLLIPVVAALLVIAPGSLLESSVASAAVGTGQVGRPAETGSTNPPIAREERHVFRVYYGTVGYKVPVARLEYTVRRQAGRYEIRTVAKADGLVAMVYSGVLTQSSVGRIGPDGLEPLEYIERRGSRPQRNVSFDHAQRRFVTANREASLELPTGTQDPLSVLYQLGMRAREAPEHFLPGSVHRVPVASMSRVSTETFSVVGESMVQSAEGPIRALHIARHAAEGSRDPRIDVWLGYDVGMLPVRLRFTDSGGKVLDQVIDRTG